ncbi:MAG: V-type ATPase 116kDa subunit family protein [Treponemataceae bacterium]
MIVPMKKVSIVVLNDEKKEALENLRKLGVVHLEQIEGKGQDLQNLKDTYSTLEKSLSLLQEIKLSKKQAKEIKKNETSLKLSAEKTVEKAKELLELNLQIKSSEEKISFLNKEIERLSCFGNFNPKDFEELNGKGIFLLPCECSKDFYENNFPENINRIYLNAEKSKVRFVIIYENEERPQGLTGDIIQYSFGEKSISEMKDDIVLEKNNISRIKAKLIENVLFMEAIKKTMKLYEKDIEFENAYSGMNTDEQESEKAKLAWISGFVPVDDLKIVEGAAKKNHWAILSDEPDDPYEVPTKLKNNKFVSLIYPLTDFLGTVPGYAEYDISGWFLFFFTIFFGMIFGDGGYGLLITLGSLFFILKGIVSKKGVAPFAGLCFLLGFATVVWGMVTCTWFGLKAEFLPVWLVNLSIPMISNAFPTEMWSPPWKPDCIGLTTAQNLQIFCFTLALLQLSVAHIKGIVRNIRSPKFLGDLGSLMQLIGMFYVVLSMVVSSEVFGFGDVINGIPIGKVAICLVGIGFVLSFIFSNYEGSVVKSVLESCKNIISVLLGVVNVFSDVVSYIRLWAVGLAGAAISNTVNEMAGPLLGHFLLFIAFVVLILFGHGLNMILNLLSVIVHGVRLNTLEFSSHLGMSWSGFKYDPFREK